MNPDPLSTGGWSWYQEQDTSAVVGPVTLKHLNLVWNEQKLKKIATIKLRIVQQMKLIHQ